MQPGKYGAFLLSAALATSMQAQGPGNTEITLFRTGCYGKCPTYHLTLKNDADGGEVLYEGIDYVKVLGRQTSRISKEKFDELIGEFTSAGYFSLKDDYCTTNMADISSTITSISMGGKTKQIINCRFLDETPGQLFRLEDKIEEVAESSKWVKYR